MYHDSDYKETKLPFATIALLCILASVVLVISSIFLGAIPFIGGVACFIAGAVFSVLNLKRYDDDVNIIIIVSLVAALIVISGCALMSTHKVDAGTEDVIVSSPAGNIGATYEPGWYFDPSFILSNFDSIRVNTQTSEYIGGTNADAVDNDGCIMILSSDALYVYIDMSVSYNVNKSSASDLRLDFGNDWKTQLIHQNVRSIPREIALKYRALDLATDNDARSAFQTEIVQKLADKIETDSKGYVHVSNIAIREVRFADELISKINEKMNAQQDLERATIEKQTASVRAESEKQVAIIEAQKQLELAQKQLEIEQANVEVEKTKAQAQAQAVIIKANAEAEAIRAKAQADADMYNLIIAEFGDVEAYNNYIKYQNTTWGIVPDGSSTIVVTP